MSSSGFHEDAVIASGGILTKVLHVAIKRQPAKISEKPELHAECKCWTTQVLAHNHCSSFAHTVWVPNYDLHCAGTKTAKTPDCRHCLHNCHHHDSQYEPETAMSAATAATTTTTTSKAQEPSSREPLSRW